jgi:hypothetical protein
MTRCRHCDTTWTGLVIAHCGECHATFTTPANFDRHRAGSKDKRHEQGVCSDPSARGLVLNPRGQWAMPGRTLDERLNEVSAEASRQIERLNALHFPDGAA